MFGIIAINRKFIRKDSAPLCACGCGEKVKWDKWRKRWNKFIKEHVNKGRKFSEEHKRKIGIANKDKKRSKKTKNKISIIQKDRSKELELKMAIARMRCRADGYCDAWSDQEFKDNCRKSHCEICKIKENKKIRIDGILFSNLLLHHIDSNPQNCHPDNLQTLCKSCHSKLHHKGRPHSKETKRRMSISAKRRNQK